MYAQKGARNSEILGLAGATQLGPILSPGDQVTVFSSLRILWCSAVSGSRDERLKVLKPQGNVGPEYSATLPQADMEPDKQPFKRIVVCKGTLCRFHVCLAACSIGGRLSAASAAQSLKLSLIHHALGWQADRLNYKGLGLTSFVIGLYFPLAVQVGRKKDGNKAGQPGFGRTQHTAPCL